MNCGFRAAQMHGTPVAHTEVSDVHFRPAIRSRLGGDSISPASRTGKQLGAYVEHAVAKISVIF